MSHSSIQVMLCIILVVFLPACTPKVEISETSTESTPTKESLAFTRLIKKLVLKRIDSDSILIEGFANRPIMINYWATWCVPCMAEMPTIYKLKRKFQDRNFEILAINLEEDIKAAMRKLEKRFGKAPFPVVNGYGTELMEFFKVVGVPFTALIDASGKVQYARPGERDWLDKASLKLVGGIL